MHNAEYHLPNLIRLKIRSLTQNCKFKFSWNLKECWIYQASNILTPRTSCIVVGILARAKLFETHPSTNNYGHVWGQDPKERHAYGNSEKCKFHKKKENYGGLFIGVVNLGYRYYVIIKFKSVNSCGKKLNNLHFPPKPLECPLPFLSLQKSKSVVYNPFHGLSKLVFPKIIISVLDIAVINLRSLISADQPGGLEV